MVCQIQVDIIWITHTLYQADIMAERASHYADTIQEAQTRSKDIWEKAQMEPNMIS